MTGRSLRGAAWALAVTLQLAACGFVTSTDGLVGDAASADDANAGDGSSASDGEADAAVEGASGLDGGSTDAMADALVDQAVLDVGPPPATCDGGFACLPLAPAGWTGPFALYAGNHDNAPSCGSQPIALVANQTLGTVAPAQCPACTCQNATGGTCGKYKLTGQAFNCAKAGSVESLSPGVCYLRQSTALIDGDGFQAAALEIGAPPFDGGTCAPTVAKPTPIKPPISWSVTAIGCNVQAAATPGCAANQVCAFVAQPPFDANQCVLKAGDIGACPGAPYSQRRVFYADAADTRDCASCTCGGPQAATCNATVVMSDTFDCTTGAPLAVPGCYVRAPSTFLSYHRVTATPPSNVTCPPAGGSAIGGVTPASPVTVCCIP